jgi:signal transduction histidine kinase
MNNRKLLRVPQGQLALSYGVMIGLVYIFIGVYTYYFTSQHYHETIDQEISFIVNTVHNNLEPKLIVPDRIDSSINEVFPDFCISSTCATGRTPQQHLTSAFSSAERYYLILVNDKDQVKATAGLAVKDTNGNFTKDAIKSTVGLTVKDSYINSAKDAQRDSIWSNWHNNIDGKHYRQSALIAHGRSLEQSSYVTWGKVYIGRDISDVENSLQSLRTGLIISFPLALLVIGGLSWYLAGRAMLPLYSAYEQQQQFAASVAHELRTPLAINQLKIDRHAAQLGKQHPAFSSALGELRSQNMRLVNIVNDLLLLAQLDRTRLENDRDCCDLDEVVLDITEEFSTLYHHHHIVTTISTQIQPVKIWGSQDRIARLVSNLLDNAIKYTPDGGHVQISITATSRYYLLKVQDTGIGINPTELKRIFDRFYRVDKDRDRRTGGIGMGLTLVRSIAQLYGAQVRAESQVGQGTAFTVAFPKKSQSLYS